MPVFKVEFEDVGFTDSKDVAESEMTDQEMLGFNEQSRKEKLFPAGVLGVAKAYVTEDDGQGNEDIKCFACVSLFVEADSEVAAEAMKPPSDLLTKIIDAMVLQDGECGLDLEGNWETGFAEKAEMPA